jgi:hypothetical protein
LEQKDKVQRAEIEQLMQSNQEWANKTKQLFIELQQNDIMREKEDYEKNIRINEMVRMLKD